MIKLNKYKREVVPKETGITIKDVFLLIYCSIFLGFVSLFTILGQTLIAGIYLFANTFLIYLLFYFAYKFKK